MLLRFVQFVNAYLPIAVTVSGSFISFNPVQSLKLQPPMLVNPSGSSISVRPVHPSNAAPPISFRLFGKRISVKLLQFLNALSDNLSIPSGTVMLFSLLSPLKMPSPVLLSDIG